MGERTADLLANGLLPLDVFEHTSYPALVTDGHGRVRLCNEAAGRLLDCPPREAVGRPCWEVARLYAREGARNCRPDCPIQQAAREGQDPGHRIVFRVNRSGERLGLHLWTFLIRPRVGGRYAVVHLMMPREYAGDGPRDPLDSESVERGLLRRLSPRERETLELLASGLDTNEVSERLGIRPATVRNHVQNLLNKLEVHRRLDAVVMLLSRGSRKSRE